MGRHQSTRRCAARVCLLVSAAAIFFAASALANAAPLYWNATQTGWNATAAWSTAPGAATPNPASVPGALDIATFRVSAGTLTTPQTVNLNGTQSALGIETNGSNQATTTILGGGSNQTLNVGTSGINHIGGGLTIGSNTAGQQVHVSLQGSQSWTSSTAGTGAAAIQVLNGVSLGVGGAHTLTLTGINTGSAISGAISDGAGTLSLTKTNGTGIWTLSGANSYSGTTTVSAGTLTIRNNTALGNTTGGTSVASGAILQLQNNITVGESLSIAGDTVGGALRNSTDTNTWSGSIAASAASSNVRIGAAAGSTLNITGNITTSGGNLLVFQADGTIDVSGDISGTAGLTKSATGAAMLTLSGNNSYDGATAVGNGVLRIQSNTALGNTTGGTSVANGAALQLQGGITVTGEALTIGEHGISNTGALRNISGTNTWTGLITMRTGVQSRIHSDVGTLILSGGVTSPGNNTLVLSGAGNGQVTSITNVFQLLKEGAGTWSLTGTSGYTTQTVVQGGTLELAAGGQLTGTSSITVGNAVGSGRLLITSSANNTIGVSTTDVILGTGGNQGTLDFQSASPVVVTIADQLIVGDSTAGSTGVVNHTGSGTLRVNGTTTIANSAGTFGQYNISAGILQANGSGGLIVGASGGSSINPALLSATGNGNATGNGTNNLVVGQNSGAFGRVSLGSGTSPTINNFLDIVVGSSGTGELAVSGASANATSVRDIQLGATSGGLGTANVSAGTVNAGRDFVVGVSSTNANAVTQTGGDVNVGRDLVIAQNAGSRGAYNISAGTLDVAARTIVGGSGGALATPATMGVSGTGIVTTADLIVGQNSGSFGAVNQTGGMINVVGNLTIGNGSGPANQNVYTLSGGTLNFGDRLAGSQFTAAPGNPASTLKINSDGAFNFNGGTLMNVTTIDATSAPLGRFTQNGGRFVIGVDGGLTPNNGIPPAEAQRAMTTIMGDYVQNPGSTLAIDVFGNLTRSTMSGEFIGKTGSAVDPITGLITDSDLVWVQGNATLDGTLAINLNGVNPGPWAWYDVLVANQITITDGRLDLVGLSSWRIIQDPSNPNRQILQVAAPEPASIALWSGVALLLAGVYFVRRRKT